MNLRPRPLLLLILALLVAAPAALAAGGGSAPHSGHAAAQAADGGFVAVPTLHGDEVPGAVVRGDYVEARTSDVWTGPCFANGEVNLEGQEAVLAWRVSDGAWQGADLSGLAVAAVVVASATLGDPHAEPLPARSLLLVDRRADDAQRAALADLARRLGGELLAEVVATEAVAIDFEIDGGEARLAAGDDLLRLETRPLGPHDTHCGNEFVYYPPLTDTVVAAPAATRVHAFAGGAGTAVEAGLLGKSWSSPDKRSAFVGRFAL